MFPELSELEFENFSQQQDLSKIGKSFLFDFKKGDFVLKDGKLVTVEGVEALKIWIEKTLRTEKYRFKVYEDTDYGITLEDLIVGYDYSQSFIEAEIKREVTEALTKHPMIESLVNWKIEKDNPTLKISFKVNLINGTNFAQEVNF